MSSFQSKQTKKQQKQNKSRKNVQAKLIKLASAPMRRANRKRGLPTQPRGLNLGNKISNRATNRRTQVIEEDEYIGEVNGSVGFATTSYPINPGQATTFPWGSKIAQLYDEYEFENLEFYYKREVSEFSTNGQAGKIILSALYDATAPAPTTKQMVEDSWPHIDGMPCTEQILLRLDVAKMKANDSHYVRYGAQPANTDLKTYDAGQLFVSTYGNTNTSVIGELHVRYRVKFAEPILEPSTVTGGAAHFSGLLPTTANNFATIALQAGYTPVLSGVTAASNVVTFPAGIPGNYCVILSLQASTSGTNVSATPSAGATALNMITVGTRNAGSSVGANLGGTVVNIAFISVATTGGVLTYSASTLVGGQGVDLFIYSLPTALINAEPPKFLPPAELQEMRDLVSELRELKMHRRLIEVRSDSDFEEDAYPMGSSSTPPRAKGADALSQSTLGLIGELIARKSTTK